MENNILIEFTDIKTAEGINEEGKLRIILPIDSKKTLLIISPVRDLTLPFFLKDFLKNLPATTIIFDRNLIPVFSNATQNINKKTADFIEKNKTKVVLKTLTKTEIEDTEFSITPLTVNGEILGFLATGKDKRNEKERERQVKELEKIIEFSEEILFLKNKSDFTHWFQKAIKFLNCEAVCLFRKGERKYLKVLGYPNSIPDDLTLPSHIEKLLKKRDFFELNAGIYPLFGQRKNTLILKLTNSETKREYILVLFPKQNTDTKKIKNLRWFFESVIFRIDIHFSRGIKLTDIFGEYPFPAILVNADSIRIVYANKKFKDVFGKDITFFNGILTPESNLKLLFKLEKEKEIFQEYVETITADGFKKPAKINVIPGINSKGVNLFAAIFKTQGIEVSLFKKEKKIMERISEISPQTILSLAEQYSFKLSKTKNIQKTVNGMLKEIKNNLKASICFIAKIEPAKQTITFSHFEGNGQQQNQVKETLKKCIKNLSKPKNKYLKMGNNLMALFCFPFLRERDFFYTLAVGFEEEEELSSIEKTFLSNTANLLSLAFQKWERNKLLSEMEKENQKIDLITEEIVSSMSHEIKTPLTSILGLCELIESAKEEEKEKIASSVKKNAKRLLELLESTLELSKLRIKGIEVVKKREVNTEEFLNSIENFAQGINKKPVVKFNIKKGKIPPSFYHDDSILFRIAVNLIDNAFSNTERGMVSFYFSIENNSIILEIRDTGKGIAKENLNKIFLPFFQETSIKAKQGNVGLGLYIVKKLCDIINAKIEVKSKLNIGTYFKIVVPLEGSLEGSYEQGVNN